LEFLQKQIIDLKALVGDPSDNISGLMKVGPKTASQLIQEFGNIEGIYQYLEKTFFSSVKKFNKGVFG